MTTSTFEKVSKTNKALYGPRKLLLCGFASDAQAKFAAVLELTGIKDVGLIWADEADGFTSLKELFARLPGAGKDNATALPRAIIMAGITEKELHELMVVSKKAGMKQALWATLTPTSETWSLSKLIQELIREREQMRGSLKK